MIPPDRPGLPKPPCAARHTQTTPPRGGAAKERLDMALRNIVTERDPMLRKVSRPVEKFDRRLRQYDNGEKIWDTAVVLIQVVRGVK